MPVLVTVPVVPPWIRMPVELSTPTVFRAPALVTLLLLFNVINGPAVVSVIVPAASILTSSAVLVDVAVAVAIGVVRAVLTTVSA